MSSQFEHEHGTMLLTCLDGKRAVLRYDAGSKLE